jgi:hypothetical protein
LAIGHRGDLRCSGSLLFVAPGVAGGLRSTDLLRWVWLKKGIHDNFHYVGITEDSRSSSSEHAALKKQ